MNKEDTSAFRVSAVADGVDEPYQGSPRQNLQCQPEEDSTAQIESLQVDRGQQPKLDLQEDYRETLQGSHDQSTALLLRGPIQNHEEAAASYFNGDRGDSKQKDKPYIDQKVEGSSLQNQLLDPMPSHAARDRYHTKTSINIQRDSQAVGINNFPNETQNSIAITVNDGENYQYFNQQSQEGEQDYKGEHPKTENINMRSHKMNQSVLNEARTQINATDMEGASSIIAGLDNDVTNQNLVVEA